MSEWSITKQALGDTLIEMCKTKRYEKITIVDITRSCGLNRQTFYYHFVDKSALLSWVYREKTFQGMGATVSLESWEVQVKFMLNAVCHYRYFYSNTVMSDATPFMTEIERITSQLIAEMCRRVEDESIAFAEDRRFYAKLYAHGCNGILIDWISSHLKKDVSQIEYDLLRLATDIQNLMILSVKRRSRDGFRQSSKNV